MKKFAALSLLGMLLLTSASFAFGKKHHGHHPHHGHHAHHGRHHHHK